MSRVRVVQLDSDDIIARNPESCTSSVWNGFDLDLSSAAYISLYFANVPKSFYMCPANSSYFYLGGTFPGAPAEKRIDIVGNYNYSQLRSKLKTSLDGNGFGTFTILYDQFLAKYTISSSQAGVYIRFVPGSDMNRRLGFPLGTHTLPDTSENIIDLQLTNVVCIYSDICGGGYNNSINNSTFWCIGSQNTTTLSSIQFINPEVVGTRRRVINKGSNHYLDFRDSNNQILDMNGSSINLTLYIWDEEPYNPVKYSSELHLTRQTDLLRAIFEALQGKKTNQSDNKTDQVDLEQTSKPTEQSNQVELDQAK